MITGVGAPDGDGMTPGYGMDGDGIDGAGTDGAGTIGVGIDGDGMIHGYGMEAGDMQEVSDSDLDGEDSITPFTVHLISTMADFIEITEIEAMPTIEVEEGITTETPLLPTLSEADPTLVLGREVPHPDIEPIAAGLISIEMEYLPEDLIEVELHHEVLTAGIEQGSLLEITGPEQPQEVG